MVLHRYVVLSQHISFLSSFPFPLLLPPFIQPPSSPSYTLQKSKTPLNQKNPHLLPNPPKTRTSRYRSAVKHLNHPPIALLSMHCSYFCAFVLYIQIRPGSQSFIHSLSTMCSYISHRSLTTHATMIVCALWEFYSFFSSLLYGFCTAHPVPAHCQASDLQSKYSLLSSESTPSSASSSISSESETPSSTN